MEERLKFIFANVNDWLKFAEAKNGVLIAINGAAIWGMLQNIVVIKTIHPCLHILSYFYIGAAFVSMIVSLMSFLPSLTLTRKAQKEIDEKSINDQSLIYFKHIALFNPAIYLTTLYHRSGSTDIPKTHNSIELDLAYQIIANARIGLQKYEIFTYALNLALVGMLIPIPFQILFLILAKLKESKEKKVNKV